MKKFISFLALIAVISVVLPNQAEAQNNGFFNDTLTSAVDSIYFYPGVDDLLAGTANETYALTRVKRFPKLGTLSVLMVSDSLSGTTAGTAVLQYSFDDEASATNRVWYTKTSLTINGAAQQQSLTSDTAFGGATWRVRVTGSGTQSTRQRVSWNFKQNE